MTIQQHNPPHPGEPIKRTYIDPFDEISGNQIAKRLGVAVSTFNRLINGVSDISHGWLYHVDRPPPCRTSKPFSTSDPKVAFNVFGLAPVSRTISRVVMRPWP